VGSGLRRQPDHDAVFLRAERRISQSQVEAPHEVQPRFAAAGGWKLRTFPHEKERRVHDRGGRGGKGDPFREGDPDPLGLGGQRKDRE